MHFAQLSLQWDKPFSPTNLYKILPSANDDNQMLMESKAPTELLKCSERFHYFQKLP